MSALRMKSDDEPAAPSVLATSRRRWLKHALIASTMPAVLSLTGCEELFRALADSCPDDPAESGGVDWTPDVQHPVFYGFQDLTAADGAPGPVRIWYPTYEGFTQGPPILKLCLVRWPVVLFLHGQPPQGCPMADYHLRWAMLPAILARSGYVVVVPSHSASLPSDEYSPAVQDAVDMIDWVRDDWENSQWVDARDEATIAAGHSYGALLAARVAQARTTIGAYVGLSGPFSELVGSALGVLQGIGAPSLFMWATGDPITGTYENLGSGGLGVWDQLPDPKYAADFPGEHFDYINSWSACGFPRGDCSLIEAVAGELTTLFVSRYVPVNLSQSQIPVSLEPASVTLTTTQQFFAGGHLSGLSQIASRAGCRVNLGWEDGADVGSRQLGP